MPVTQEGPVPYAPPSAILDLVRRHRDKGLPSPVDADVLARAGVPDSLVPRTLQALKILELLNADGTPSDALERMRLAPEAEYQERMAEWLKAAYADALTYVNPAVDGEVAIRDAFRKYTPVGQQSRMVTLFMGLFTAAGVMPERSRALVVVKNGGSSKAAPRPASRPPRIDRKNQRDTALPHGGTTSLSGMPPALAGLLADLPADGEGWTAAKRDKFMTTLAVIVDYCFPVIEEPAQTETATGA